ncbi:hypothetical protein Clacol_008365 [Clathrus columnatus]|uniref:Uncharacterized protein n=1 Tax=Clathrus columnatus TaxID=1419009 RepID=A0AAV5ALZ4_9AGAM|nr:hypothetical protein Clacol_008365 [Clathrus columnatus]
MDKALTLQKHYSEACEAPTHQKELEAKDLKKRDYTKYNDDEFKPGNEGMKRAVLPKYDEVNDAPEITKKKRPARRAGDNALNGIPAMTDGMQIHIDTKPKSRVHEPDENSVDDEDLSNNTKSCNHNARAETAVAVDVEVKEKGAGDGEEPVKVKREEPVQPPIKQRTDSPVETDKAVYEPEAGEVIVKEEDDDIEDEVMLNAIEADIRSSEAQEQASGVEVDVGTPSEQASSAGLASTISVLRSQGISAAPTSEQVERDEI